MLHSCPRLIVSSKFWAPVLLIVIDHLSKNYVWTHQHLWPKRLTPFLNIVFVKNRGISFGLFNKEEDWLFWCLTGVIILIISYVTYLLYKTKHNIMRWGLSLVLGGAIGNVIDRFVYGGVIDFIDVHIQSFHWPAFNAADSFIFMGTVLLLKNSLKEA